MAANKDRGEVDIRIGDQTRTLRFRTAECALLEQSLEMDPMLFIATNRGRDTFLIKAIIAGLSRNAGKEPVTPSKVATWLDADGVDKKALQKDILYAIARGKTAEEAKRLVESLDAAYRAEEGDDVSGGAGPLAAS